jgi:general secretion pathway protein F
MRYEAKVFGADQRISHLSLDASDEHHARRLACDQGYAVVSIRRTNALTSALRARGEAFSVVLFSIELTSLLEAGLNVVEALQTLLEQADSGAHKRVLHSLVGALHRGETLSQAVGRQANVFPALYTATIRSSERTGDLKEALRRYIAYRAEIDKVRKRVINALLYPAILAVVGTGVVGFLLLYVVPRFAGVYEQMSAELPFYSRLLVGLAGWMQTNGPLALVIVGTLIAACIYGAFQPKPQRFLLDRIAVIPLVGRQVRMYQLARLYRTFGMLVRSGVPAIKAFDMIDGLLPPDLRPRLARAKAMVNEGHALSAALTSVGLATPVASRMMGVGERGGQMGDLMERIARFYDDATARSVDAFTRVFEPVLMAAIGIGVGVVVILMYMPIFELANSVQ